MVLQLWHCQGHVVFAEAGNRAALCRGMHFRLYWRPESTVHQNFSSGGWKVAKFEFFLDRSAGTRDTEGKLRWHELPVAVDYYHKRHIAMFQMVLYMLLWRILLTVPVQ